jgi:hypothetical protein
VSRRTRIDEETDEPNTTSTANDEKFPLNEKLRPNCLNSAEADGRTRIAITSYASAGDATFCWGSGCLLGLMSVTDIKHQPDPNPSPAAHFVVVDVEVLFCLAHVYHTEMVITASL